MTPQPVPSRAELLAALQLQYEWGVDEALSEETIDRLSEASRVLPERTSGLSRVQSPSEAPVRQEELLLIALKIFRL